jgi:peptidoglycan biosynthesis protein MviN/MurJ (putative lipid II flippase)
MFVWSIIKRTVGIGFVVGGLALYGMDGLLLGMVLNTWFSYFVNISLVSKHVGYKWWKQLLDILPMMVAAAVAAAVSYLTADLLHLSIYPDGLVKLFIYCIVYLGWSLLFKPEAFLYTKSIVTPMFSKIRKKFSRK